MPDEQLRNDFAAYLKQLKRTWTIEKKAEITIMQAILGHTGNKLTAYIGYFKHLIWQIENGNRTHPDIYSKNPPADGKYVDSFVGAGVTTQNYTSNYALRLFFSGTEHAIYRFDVLC